MDLETGEVSARHAVYFDEHNQTDTRNSSVDFSEESEETKDLVYFPSLTFQCPDLPSNVIAPSTGNAQEEDPEDQTPSSSTRDELEQLYAAMPALEEEEEADAFPEPVEVFHHYSCPSSQHQRYFGNLPHGRRERRHQLQKPV